MTKPAKITVSESDPPTDDVGAPPIATIEDVRRELREQLLDSADRMRGARVGPEARFVPPADEVEALARAYVILGDTADGIDPATHELYVARVKALEDRGRRVIYIANELGGAYFEAPVFERLLVALRDLDRELNT